MRYRVRVTMEVELESTDGPNAAATLRNAIPQLLGGSSYQQSQFIDARNAKLRDWVISEIEEPKTS